VSYLRLRQFLLEEHGQDFTEYALLLAFVALVCGAILTSSSKDATRIWLNASSRLGGA
jgi:Flp pilus assembly pilin Flp